MFLAGLKKWLKQQNKFKKWRLEIKQGFSNEFGF